jgi:hypothetical protein
MPTSISERLSAGQHQPSLRPSTAMSFSKETWCCGALLFCPAISRMQLAVNAQVPKELGGLGAQVLYIGRCALVVGRCAPCLVLDLVVHTTACS